jgi:hypothetical protein
MVDVNFLKNHIRSEFINQILCMEIDKWINFNDMNYGLMQAFMDTKINSRNDIMNHLGDDAHFAGDSTAITGQVQRPSYTNGMNYLDEFATVINSNERAGVNTPRTSQITSSDNPYPEVVNLYPDDLDSGDGKDFHKWRLDENDNSILYKTKKLFKEKKINTIISRFGTSADNGGSPVWGNGDSRTEYGMSHGRNLLKKGAEENGEIYNINGYNNPYCRVWTHHYQYDRLDKLIRPFVKEDEYGNTLLTSLKDLHKWKGFERPTSSTEAGVGTNMKIQTIAGWKNDGNGWEKSVLDDNGFVKITPKYLGGGEFNIHTKDCMFSIENLAWRGYDPYSFENALSWEQRGPLGGRIMWFPPYGLSFNETTQANWSSNTFIGRGEDVYTYVNTVRSGTLSFIMLTDHPSVIDYANWYETDDNQLKDTDILRFFAGCDSGDSNDPDSIFSKVKPTPLTDEYIQEEEIDNPTPNPKPEPPIKPEPIIKEDVQDIHFYVFYPNNYSGTYDYPSEKESSVNSIAYLLGGDGCNKFFDFDDENYGHDIEISFDNFSPQGNGYEMGGNGISTPSQDANKNYIVGSKITWSQAKSKNIKKYQLNTNKKWYYRIDGVYEPGVKNIDFYRNTYDQTLVTTSNYSDNKGYSLNLDADAVKNSQLVSDGEENIYSLAEIACAIAKGKEDGTVKYQGVYDYLSTKVNEERLNKLVELFSKYKLTNVEAIGYSNSHGTNPNNQTNVNRNDKLADERAKTVINWLIDCAVMEQNTPHSASHRPSQPVEGENKRDKANASSQAAKIYRSAKVTMTFSLTETENLSDTNSEEENGITVYQKYNDYVFVEKNSNGRDVYKSTKDGTIWIEQSDGKLVKTIEPYERSIPNGFSINDSGSFKSIFISVKDKENKSVNKLRYDQEYHFYKKLEKDNPIVFAKLKDKLKYFDPAFHSMTPEGFTERLTFLNQCTRQGNTISASDGVNGKTASNLAFGRPPFCVLRIGDFYYQTIVIDSINIDYNVSGGLQWDLNPEGTGVQPMLAQINISFKFIGGGDLGGPIRRLQNAMTFNYYANSRLHDNRADRIEYNWDDKSNGALDYGVNSDDSFAYTTRMSKNK